MGIEVGSVVVINRCETCPAVVGKIVKVRGFAPLGEEDSTGVGAVVINYGKGRPQSGRPFAVPVTDVSVVEILDENIGA